MMSYVPNYALIVKNIDGNPDYPLKVELRENNDDQLITSVELKTLEDTYLNPKLGERFDPLELPMYVIRELKKKL